MNSLKKPKRIEDCRTIVDFAYRNRYKQLTKSKKFLQIFKAPLSKFWESQLIGFDIMAFDKFIAPTARQNTYEATLEKFGQEAVDLVKTLI